MIFSRTLITLSWRTGVSVSMLWLFITADLFAQTTPLWTSEFPTVGVYSSIRTADLNGDGVKDIIIAAGRHEFEPVDTAVVAVSGATGETLWTVPSRDQMFGSAGLIDITGDGVEDIVIGGRSATLFAIEGSTGRILWEFFDVNSDGTSDVPSEQGYYNFYNPQFIPDQTGNGKKEILISNGGDVRVPAGDPDRPPGRIMVIESESGRLIANAVVPDDKETYMSPVVARMNDQDEELTVIFGTGGETMGGGLYRTTLSRVMEEDLSDAILLAESREEKGFIAPPVLADLTLNGTYDIIANAFEGRMIAINGDDHSTIWEAEFEGVEAYASPAAGYMSNDSIPDFFTTYGIGTWPEIEESKQVLVRGATGEVLYSEPFGLSQTGSPIIYDVTGNGFDNVILSTNVAISDLEAGMIEMPHNFLAVFDYQQRDWYQISELEPGMNISCTPWLGDLDGDGHLDILNCSLTQVGMDGFIIQRLHTGLIMNSDVRWGAYMGSDYDGVFRGRDE